MWFTGKEDKWKTLKKTNKLEVKYKLMEIQNLASKKPNEQEKSQEREQGDWSRQESRQELLGE